MILQITTLCLAIYTAPHATTPKHVECTSFTTPVAYDTTQCRGEVITNRKGDIATCEVTRP